MDSEKLDECLREQAEARVRGQELPLGQILLERGSIKPDDLIRLGKEQGRRSSGMPDLPRYEFRSVVGQGATAVVHQAWDRELKRPVAIKVLRESAGLSETARQRFRREAQVAAGLSHPNVVAVYDAGESNGHLYLVMELVEGRSLGEILEERKIPQKQLLEILEKAARGVAAAHAKGIIHRDLKPANILVTQAGEPKVGDFGLAHLTDSTTELTKTGTTLGTPLYMSPEQVSGRTKEISPATDVHALGAMLYEILVGRTPHTGETLAEIYEKIVKEEPVAPHTLDAQVSSDLETIALKALEKEAVKRYSGAQAFQEDLRRALDGEPILAKPLSAPARLWRILVRKRALLLPSAASLILAAILIFVLAGRRKGVDEGVRDAPEGKGERWVMEGQPAKFEVRTDGAISFKPLAGQQGPLPNGPAETSDASTSFGLVASFDFEEQSGQTAADGSGNGNTATLVGKITRTAGHRGSGLGFDGQGYLTVQKSPSLDLGMKSFTVACWVKPTSNDPHRLLSMWDGTRGWIFGLNDPPETLRVPGGLRFELSDGIVRIDHKVKGPIAIGAWQHVAATVDRSSNELRLYLNGVQIGTSQSLWDLTESLDQKLSLGIGQLQSALGHRPLSGALDEVRLYNRALSPREVAHLASTPEVASGELATKASSPRPKTNDGAPIQYQWQKQISGETTWKNVGINAASYLIPTTSRSDNGSQFRVIVTSSRGSATSTPAILMVTPVGSLPPIAAAWAFDEGSGTVTADFSGNRNAGTLVNSPDWASGKDGIGLSFGKGGYVTVNDSSSIDISGTEFSLSFWAILASSKDEQVLIDKPWDPHSAKPPNYNTDFHYGIVWLPWNQKFSLILGDDQGVFRTCEIPSVLDAWAHVAFTHDGRSMKGYLNGEFRFSASDTFKIAARRGPLRIGTDRTGGKTTHGKLDNIRIYARALSPTEIQADMKTSVGGISIRVSLPNDVAGEVRDR